MIKNVGLWVCVAGLCFLCVNCTGAHQAQKKTSFYLFEYDPPIITDKKLLPDTLRIKRFEISPAYDTDRIVFSDKKFTREDYNYHKWRSNPRDLVTYYLTRDLSRSQLFKAVFPHYHLGPTAYCITGTIDDFYESGGDVWEAVLSVNIVLFKENEPDLAKRVVFQKQYSSRKTCAEKSPAAIAQAMGSAMADISSKVIADIYQRLLTDHPANKSPSQPERKEIPWNGRN
jgi:ABC-type uncharacterized transport system auxiliary subunit